MIWGAFYGKTKDEAVILKSNPNSMRGGVTAERYLACLKEYLPRLMQGKRRIFMHNGALIHTANLIKDWLSEQGYTAMLWRLTALIALFAS